MKKDFPNFLGHVKKENFILEYNLALESLKHPIKNFR